MARVLVFDGSLDTARLYAHVAEAAGHSAAAGAPPSPVAPARADVVIVDPTAPGARAWLREVRRLSGRVAVICVSIYPRSPEADDFAPTSYLVKPFALDDLRDAIERALTTDAGG